MRIALVRHPKPLIAPGICYGRLEMALHPSGEAELPAIAARLAGFAQIVSSPAARCRRTAEAISTVSGADIAFDERLLELDFGAWEGCDWNDVARAELDRWAAAPLSFAAPRGESGTALVARVTAFHADLLRAGRDCVVVSHGGPLRVLAALLRGGAVDLLAAAPPLGSVEIVAV